MATREAPIKFAKNLIQKMGFEMSSVESDRGVLKVRILSPKKRVPLSSFLMADDHDLLEKRIKDAIDCAAREPAYAAEVRANG